MRWLLRWLAFGAMLVLLHVIGASSAHAQTNTPTPTRTPPITPYVTPTPTGQTPTPTPTVGPTPTPGAPGSTVLWGCLLYPGGAAPICTWGDYFETEGHTYVGPGAGQVYWPGPTNNDYLYVRLWPPSDTRQINATCTHDLRIAGYREVFGSISAATRLWWEGISGVAALQTPVPSNVAYTTLGTSGVAVTQGSLLTYNVKWRLSSSVASWPGSTFPTYATANSFVGWRVQTSNNTDSDPNNISMSYNRVACEITSIERLDGSTYVPTKPLVGDAPTPTPTACIPGQPCGGDWALNPFPTPISWVHVPEPIEFGRTPTGSTVCYTLIPAFSWGPYTVFGYELEFTLPDVEICNSSFTIGWVIFGIDFGAWAVGLLIVAGVGMLYSRLR